MGKMKEMMIEIEESLEYALDNELFNHILTKYAVEVMTNDRDSIHYLLQCDLDKADYFCDEYLDGAEHSIIEYTIDSVQEYLKRVTATLQEVK